MICTGSVHEKLNSLICPDSYGIVECNEIIITEKTRGSEARVTCQLASTVRTICLKPGDTRSFLFLKEQKSPDGVMLVPLADGAYAAHLLECKKTLTEDEWSKAKRQMGWAVLRIKAIAAVLDITIKRVSCYTAFRKDALATNPGLYKLPIEGATPEVSGKEREVLLERSDWNDPMIEIKGFANRFAHYKVQLDCAGVGCVSLNSR